MKASVIPFSVFITLSAVISSCNRSEDTVADDRSGINAEVIEALKLVQSYRAEKSPKEPDGPKPTSAAGYINLSLQYYNDGNWEKCITASIEALNFDPSYAVAYNNICAAYLQLEDYERAILACNKALALKSDFPLATNNLNAAIKQKQGK